jgi:predicted ATPase
MTAEPALRILIITSRPLIDSAGNAIQLLDVEEERRRIATGLRRAGVAVRVHFLPEATTSAVKVALMDKWDVAHFTGHGTEDGLLLLENGLGEAQFLTKEEAAKLFAAQQSPLVVLSACHSETIARGLLAGHVATVVAIDASKPIADRAAIIFAEHFYSALSKGWGIQSAFDDAQKAVALDSEVGDSKPPVDENNEEEETWSQRFKLIGEANRTLKVGAGEYQQSGARWHADGNLRPRNRNFVGRAKEISGIVTAFDKYKAQRVAIFAAGGLGKTELSKGVAWWYIERERVDGVLWASASRDEGEYKLRNLATLLSIAGQVFKLPVTEQMIFDEQKRIVREFLEAHRVLIILDNWETIEGPDRRELWDFVLSLPATTRVLVTSRDFLPPKDARNIELDTLAPDDAIKLFANVARNAGYIDRSTRLSSEEGTILGLICERLGGYPLAIEVVAGQTVSRTLQEIWNDLQNIPKNVLEGKDELTGEPRGVWTSLGFSYDVLSDGEKKLFRQLSILLVPASAEDIGAITTVENSRTVLDTLVKRSLVRMREGKYALLPVVRAYAESKLEEAGEDMRELHERAANHYREKKTLEGAMAVSGHLFELAMRFDSREAAEAFVKYVPTFYYDLIRLGYWVESRRQMEKMIAVARSMGDKKTEAGALNELASAYHRVGEYEQSRESCETAKKLFEEIDDKRGIANALHLLGMLAGSNNNYSEAERFYRKSLEIRVELGGKGDIARSQVQLGMIQVIQGDYGEAENRFQHALKIGQELNAKELISAALQHLGRLMQLRKRYDEAGQLYEQGFEFSKESEDMYGIATALGQIGGLAIEQGRMKEALHYSIKAYRIFEELKSPYRAAIINNIRIIRNKVGEEKFAEWIKEFDAREG